jgi:hypothetical protein
MPDFEKLKRRGPTRTLRRKYRCCLVQQVRGPGCDPVSPWSQNIRVERSRRATATAFWCRLSCYLCKELRASESATNPLLIALPAPPH